MKQFIKTNFKNIIILILTILSIVFVVTRFTYMFGSNTDWLTQHIVIPDYFRQQFYKTGNILPNFAFNYGGGQNIFNISYYGLLSPIILLSYLFPYINMAAYITITSILILIISAILFYKWMMSKYSKNISLLLSIIFILASPIIFHMHRHIMFVNYMPFLILSFIGIDKLIQENKKTLLIISVFLMIMTSYYYSVSGIVVLFIYYIYEIYKKNKKILSKNILNFIIPVLISVGLSAILILPTLYTMLLGRNGENTYTINELLTPNLKLQNLLYGTYTIGISSIIIVSLLYLFYTRKKHNIILGIFITIILLFPISRYLLNGGLYLRPKCFIPFIPLLIYIIGIFINDLFNKKIEIKKFIIYILIMNIIFIFTTRKLYYLDLFGLLFMIYISYKIKNKKVLGLYLIILSFIICISDNLSESRISIEFYNKLNNNESEIQNILKRDNTYYRFNNLYYPSKNINKIYDDNYLTTNMYSSTYNNDYLKFIRETFKLNIPDVNYFIVSSPDNILFNSFMGVKYLYSTKPLELGYKRISDNVYQNELALPIIYASNNIMSEQEFDKLEYPYNVEALLNNVIVNNYSNNYANNTSIEKEELDYILNYNKDNIEINDNQIIVKKNDKILIKLNKKLYNKLLFINIYGLKEQQENISMTINGQTNLLTYKNWTYDNKNNTFHFLINQKEIDNLEVSLTKGIYDITDIEAYTMEYRLNRQIDKFNITEYKNDTIKGNINVKDNSYLVTSIPYDKGFNIKIDGKEIEYEKINKAFIGFKINPGNHNIEIKYNSPWLKEGKIISLISLFTFILLIIVEKNKKNKKI